MPSQTIMKQRILLFLIIQTSAHMLMSEPPSLRYNGNPNTGSNIDYDLTAPLDTSGSDYPCKNSLSLLGTSEAKPVASWEVGAKYQVSIKGGARHGGGSCQLSLSFDQGKNFYVIRSYIGNCPPSQGLLDFMLPSDTPESEEAIFSWTWFNKIGNREMYMNCAVVSISSSATNDTFFSRPRTFTANISNGCSTAAGKDLDFPDPGPDAVYQGSDNAPPEGSCAPQSINATEQTSWPSLTHMLSSKAKTLTADLSGPLVELPTKCSRPLTSSESPTADPHRSSEDPTPAFSTCESISTVVPSIESVSIESFKPGTKCTSDGLWNCVDGTGFQRCANGAWTVVLAMAAGTRCTPGISESFNRCETSEFI